MSIPRLTWPAIACIALFAITSLLESSGISQALDVQILQLVDSWRTPALTVVMQAASSVGNWQWEVPFALLVTTVLWLRARRGNAWRYFAMCLLGEALYAVVKLLFHRPRPTVISHLGQAGWYSYPSGHSMLAPIIWGTGLVLLSRLVDARTIKRAFMIAAAIIPVVIAKSRVYLGVHYPTDVIGGLALGTAWVLIWWDAVSRAPTAAAPTTQ